MNKIIDEKRSVMEKRRKSLVPGFILIFIGMWIFADNHHYFYDKWEMLYPGLILLFAVIFFLDAIRGNKPSMVFWGTAFSVVGAFFVLRNYGVLPYFDFEDYWPVFFVGLGTGFLSLFLINLKDWGALIPAGLFLFIGIGFCMTNMFNVFWDFDLFLEKYWPVLLVFTGIGLVANGLIRHKPKLQE